jgi:radical SAM superfamily enzyme YgiQ (UPF0313 family)
VRVLLLSPNRSRITVPPFPLGLACVVANLDAERHAVEVWDALFHDNWEAVLRDRLRRFRPEVVGVSVRNVDDQEMRAPHFFVDEVRQMVAVCREESPAALVAGGSGFSLFPAQILAYLGVDYGVIGEGERAFQRVLERLEAGRDLAGVPGVVWQEDGRIRSTPLEWIEPLDDLAPADRERLEAARYYDTRGSAGIPNTATVQSKRGCPLRCIYCSTPAIEGRTIRVRSPLFVVDEIEQLRKRGFQRMHFVDSLFTNPPWHARAICEELLRRRLDVRWSATINPAFADPDLLELMKRAGCVLVMVGNESGCSRMLRALRKGFERAEVERCFAACQREGLPYNAFLLLGGPGEDRESVEESIELLERSEPNQLTVTVGIRLYPGCELTRLAQREGVITPATDLLRPQFYLATGVRDWIWDHLESVLARQPRWTS